MLSHVTTEITGRGGGGGGGNNFTQVYVGTKQKSEQVWFCSSFLRWAYCMWMFKRSKQTKALSLILGNRCDRLALLWKTAMLFPLCSYEKGHVGLDDWQMAWSLPPPSLSLLEWDGVLPYLYDYIFCDFFFLLFCVDVSKGGKKIQEIKAYCWTQSHSMVKYRNIILFFRFVLSFSPLAERLMAVSFHCVNKPFSNSTFGVAKLRRR